MLLTARTDAVLDKLSYSTNFLRARRACLLVAGNMIRMLAAAKVLVLRVCCILGIDTCDWRTGNDACHRCSTNSPVCCDSVLWDYDKAYDDANV
jgi:hypothetical protein